MRIVIFLIALSVLSGSYGTFVSPGRYLNALSYITSAVPLAQGINGTVFVSRTESACGGGVVPDPRALTRDLQVAVHSMSGSITYVLVDWNNLNDCSIGGVYHVALPPGRYAIHLVAVSLCLYGVNDVVRSHCDLFWPPIDVKANMFSTFNITIDTGIE